MNCSHYSLMGSRTPTRVSTWPRTWKAITARWRWSYHLTWMRRLGEMVWESISTITPTANPTWLKSWDAHRRISASWQLPPFSSLLSVRIVVFLLLYMYWWCYQETALSFDTYTDNPQLYMAVFSRWQEVMSTLFRFIMDIRDWILHCFIAEAG